MSINQDDPKYDELVQKNLNDEFDFKQIYFYLSSNKKFIAFFGFIGIFISTIFSLSLKKTWQGEFQIVLKPNQEMSSLTNRIPIRLGPSLGSRYNPLINEVGILKSPSILMNVFEFVKNQKALKEKNISKKAKIQEMKFQDWRENNLKIALQKNTSILNLFYTSTDKEIILPVLNKISNAYQDYSGRARLRELELSSTYLKEQIEIYIKKSKESFRKAQQFATDNDLSSIGNVAKNFDRDFGIDSKIDKEAPGLIENSIFINEENLRIEAINKIRTINEKLKQIESLGDDKEQIIYFATSNSLLKDVYANIKALDKRISELKISYQETDKIIQNEITKRQLLVEFFSREIVKVLKAERRSAEALLKASERPKGVIIEYRQILNEASRDKLTLLNLENQLRAISLEQARTKDPWELITSPTLYPDPVGPKKKQIVAVGLLIGLSVGLISSFALNKNKDKILTANGAEALLGFPLINEFLYPDIKNWDQSLELIMRSKFIEGQGKIGFLLLGDLENIGLNNIKNSFNKYLKKGEFVFTENILGLTNYTAVIIITSLGIIKKRELIDLKKKLFIQNKKIVGFMLIEEFSKKL